jgi:hypothetical protein
MLHDAGQITESDIDELHTLVLDVPKQLIGICEQHILLVTTGGGSAAVLDWFAATL